MNAFMIENKGIPMTNPQEPLLCGDKVFTIPEVAAYLKISKSKIHDLVSREQIPHLKVGWNVRIRETDLSMWVEPQIDKAPL